MPWYVTVPVLLALVIFAGLALLAVRIDRHEKAYMRQYDARPLERKEKAHV